MNRQARERRSRSLTTPCGGVDPRVGVDHDEATTPGDGLSAAAVSATAAAAAAAATDGESSMVSLRNFHESLEDHGRRMRMCRSLDLAGMRKEKVPKLQPDTQASAKE